MILYILIAIVIFGVLIALHELGHFVAAKLCGVRVNEFSFGMGPLLFQKVKGETEYSIRLFPVGGYVAMEGESEDSDDERAFFRKPAWQRFIILFAGAAMNILLGLGILIGLVSGQELLGTTVIAGFDEGIAASQYLQSGDRITRINGYHISGYNDALFQLLRDERLIIAGPNGTGKSTLLQVLDGHRRPSSGMVRLGQGARPSIFTQQQARRAGRVIDAIWDKYPRFTELEVRSHLARFNFRGEDVFKPCSNLSGGELGRLRLAEMVLERPNLLFMDEPTNHLDIYTRESLTQALAAYEGALVLVTHDRYLMQTLACPILYIEDGKAVRYESFAALMNRNKGEELPAAKEPAAPARPAYGKEQRKRRADLRARLKAVEDEIEAVSAKVVELENEINSPEVLRDHVLLRDKCDELEDTRFHQQELFDEWEKLLEEQEQMEKEE